MVGAKWLSVLWLAAAYAFASCQLLVLPDSAKESAEGLSQFIRENIRKAPSSELDKLVENPDMTISLAAGWERVLRTIPEKSGDGLHAVDKKATTQFLKLVRQRVGVPIPKLWYKTVEKTMHNYDGSVWFLPGLGYDRELDKRFQWVSSRSKLVQKDGLWSAVRGRTTVALPTDIIQDRRQFVSLIQTKDIAYVAFPSDIFYPYKLYSLSLKNHTIRWSADVWIFGYVGMATGWWPPPGIEFAISGSKLFIFGYCLYPYLEVFDIDTGKNLYRFCPGYLRKDR